jgi:hypothetical protein
MKPPTIGRNDPCPCGSGKKFKKCCMEKDRSAASGGGAAEVSDELREAMVGRQFNSLAEVQAFADRYTRQRNQRPLDEFHGLSPEQMYCLIHSPFTSPELVSFPDMLDTIPEAPVMTLFTLLAEAIGKQGLKSTAKGNLPQKFCREAALTFRGENTLGESPLQENIRFRSINREEDFFDLHVTRLVAELAGLIRKYKGHFILSRDCRSLLNKDATSAIYLRLLKTYIEKFNWAYRDGYPEIRFIQSAFLFTLYLLTRYGDTWRPHTFYEDSFLNAFPRVLDEMPPDTIGEPDKQVRNCYTWRTLVDFTGFFGLAAVEPVSEQLLYREYRVKGLPLLYDAVQFHI